VVADEALQGRPREGAIRGVDRVDPDAEDNGGEGGLSRRGNPPRLGNGALAFEARQAVFAFEEAVGFAVLPGRLPDKDAVLASVVVAEMAHWLAREGGKDLLDKLEDIYPQYGDLLFDNAFFMCDEPAVIVALFERMRTGGKVGDMSIGPGSFPSRGFGI
jgi:hypothetical protein